METLKFVMVSTYYPPHHLGGDATFVSYVSKELVKRGHEVHVFYNSRAYELFRKGEQRLDAEPMGSPILTHQYSSRIARLDPVLALTLGLWGRARDQCKRIIADIRPDVVHWHNTRGFIGRPFATAGAVNLFTSHDYTPICPRSSLLRPGMELCEEPRMCTICMLRCGKPPHLWRAGGSRLIEYPSEMKILTPSEFMAARLQRENIPVHRVLRGFVPDAGGRLADEGREARSIVYMGLMEAHKGVESLLDAFAGSRDRQGFDLHFIGEGRMREALARRVHDMGLADRVKVHGFLPTEQLFAIRRDAAAQVVPSIWYENAPAVALEALSCGIPVLASDIGGLPEIASPESGSELFGPGDVPGLTDVIVSLWETRGELRERRKKARMEYERRFAPEVHMTSYLDVIRELERGAQRPSNISA